MISKVLRYLSFSLNPPLKWADDWHIGGLTKCDSLGIADFSFSGIFNFLYMKLPLTYLLTYLLTYSLHGAQSFLRS
jgi:hypothetical protein